MSNYEIASAAIDNCGSSATNSAPAISGNTNTLADFSYRNTDKPRIYVCATCQRSFTRLEHVKRHELSHTKAKPFRCSECMRCFSRSDLLHRHQQKLHQRLLHRATPDPRPRNSHKATADVTAAKNSRKSHSATVNATGSNPVATTLRASVNTIGYLDNTDLEKPASVTASVTGGMAAHSRHSDAAAIQAHNGADVPGDMVTTLGHGDIQYGLPKLETSQLSGDDIVCSDLWVMSPVTALSPEIDFEDLDFELDLTISHDAIHCKDFSQLMSWDQTSSFEQILNDVLWDHDYDNSLTVNKQP